MKKIRFLLLALGSVFCVSLASCDFSLALTSTSGTNSTSESSGSADGSSDSDSLPDSVSDSASMTESASASGSDDSSESSGKTEEKPDDSGSTGGDSGNIEVPENCVPVTVTFYTIQSEEGGSLTLDTYTEYGETLGDFLSDNMQEMCKLYNEAHGFTDENEWQYDGSFFTGGFWQLECDLLFTDKVFLSEASSVAHANLLFTPSGAGMNIELYIDESEDEPAFYSTPIPFPAGVYFSDFVDWAYNMKIVSMSYEDSLKVGKWIFEDKKEEVPRDHIVCGDSIRFTYNSSDVGGAGGDIGGDPSVSSFTAYLSVVFDFSYSEENVLVGVSSKEGLYDFYSSVSIKEAYTTIFGGEITDSEGNVYEIHWYIDGMSVIDSAMLTSDCAAAVGVIASVDKELDEFTVSVALDGYNTATYTYTHPVTLFDLLHKYCTERNLDYTKYVWSEFDMTAISPNLYEVYVSDTTISGGVYTEPGNPETVNVSVKKYDGETETTETYTVAYESNFADFVRGNLLSTYDQDNTANNEYAFYAAGDGSNECDWFMSFTYATEIYMLKRSVLEAGYNVSCDLLISGISDVDSKTFQCPTTLRGAIWEVTGWDLYDYQRYQFTVNGEVLGYNDEKIWSAMEYDLYYKDLTIEVRSVYTFEVSVVTQDESEKSKTLTYTDMPSFETIAKALGLSRDVNAYCWRYSYGVGGSGYESAEIVQPDQWPMSSSDGYFCLYVGARTVGVNLYYVDEWGNDIRLEPQYTDAQTVGEWSVTVAQALQFYGMDIDPDDFTWIAKGPNGEQNVTAESELTYAIPEEYDYYEGYNNYITWYTLTGTRKTSDVKVYTSDMDEGTVEARSFATGTTIEEIIEAFGYNVDELSFIVESLNGGTFSEEFSSINWQKNTPINRPIKIILYPKTE